MLSLPVLLIIRGGNDELGSLALRWCRRIEAGALIAGHLQHLSLSQGTDGAIRGDCRKLIIQSNFP